MYVFPPGFHKGRMGTRFDPSLDTTYLFIGALHSRLIIVCVEPVLLLLAFWSFWRHCESLRWRISFGALIDAHHV